jgi:hypothetical protein
MSLKNLGKIAKIVEKYMLDEVEIFRPGAQSVDPVTLVLTTASVDVYSGKAMVLPMGSPAETRFSGQHTIATMFEVAIPRDAEPVLPNDEVVVSSSLNNPDMEGKRFIVIGDVDATFKTHRRLSCRLREDAE